MYYATMVNQIEFWTEISRNHKFNKRSLRVVPAFTIQSLQENTIVAKPPKCSSLYDQRQPKLSVFRKYYERGIFPITLDTEGAVKRISWKINLDQLDYYFYLPLFFDGLTEKCSPYSELVEQGISDMLDAGGVKVLSVLPQLIKPIKKALDTKIPELMCRTLRIIQRLVRSGNCIGESLVPYFRQILPVLNLLIDQHASCTGTIDYAQQKGLNVSDFIQETLQVLEQYGGEDAFINIKYIIPTYESCMKN